LSSSRSAGRLLSQSLDDKATAIKRLLRMIFGATTEIMEKVLKNRSKLADAIKDKPESEPVKPNGHGKNGAADYIGAERIQVSNENLKVGAPCPECPKGKVYPIKPPGVAVRFVGMAPLAAKIYELEKLRCNLCGVVFTANAPSNVGSAKYDETVGSMIASLKYGSGVPFYRIEKLQESLGLPLPASTQWDIVEQAANRGVFPEETGHVIGEIAQVYRNDKTAKELNLSPQERLLFHQRESGPLMKNLKQWLSEQIEQKKAEPNSGLGKAIAYMLKHWEPLTLFLRAPGAPLDNNICERALKKAILNRKNSLFYKTEHGAFIGDMFMSLIHTCNLSKVNPFDYLTALQKNASVVFKNPRNWMPWNYQEGIPVNDS
jgi:hypothetical protein